jgi:tellurite resistance protein
MMSADGSASSVEREVLRGAVRALTDGQLSGAVIDAMLARFDQALARDGQAARLAHVAAQLSGDRADAETAFSLAAALALADAGANPRELELLEELGEQLGLSRERRQALIAG